MLAGHREPDCIASDPLKPKRLLLVAGLFDGGVRREIGKYYTIDAELSIVDDIPKVTAIAPVVDTVLGI